AQSGEKEPKGSYEEQGKQGEWTKSQKPKSSLTARPPPLHGAPAPSFLDEEVFCWWRGRTTEMARPHHPNS
ncbi:hypothetical protein PIB30_092566, partial [Stylosanthes scabra]|nr:hypothetical protein [Stylosanthes scabra]